ncbi:MAG: DUF3604 domain-containing protein [Candidatus Binatia bacterium]|nr:DUF3604 domain-containing protein [Candidatus Binatia bacterium]
MRRALRILGWTALGFLAVAVLLVLVSWPISEGVFGELYDRGVVTTQPQPSSAVEAKAARQAGLAPEGEAQVLFGDLHVHTTFSADAFVFSLPMFQGEGVHPPADACDFARFCAELDFFSLNDHAEFITPRQWTETKASVRECNAVAGDAGDPDLVAFLGWEWTQSANPLKADGPHYGHKNVILLGTEDDEVPVRPIGAGSGGLFSADVPGAAWAALRVGITVLDMPAIGPYLDLNRWVREVRGTEDCPAGVPVRELSEDCFEGASSPDLLFAKLDDWGYESLVIPHGTAWGIHAPRGSSLALQLEPGMQDEARQRLFEVYSGHGSSEVYRELLEFSVDENGERACEPPSGGFLPCCWRAGEIILKRCGKEGLPEAECTARAELAREYMAEASGPGRYNVVPGTNAADWLECGQLPEGFLPAYEYRPQMSAQYGLAARGFRPDGGVSAFRYGLIGSSDNHKARAGSSYKEIGRKAFGDAYGLNDAWTDLLSGPQEPSSQPVSPGPGLGGAADRNASFYYTAGLVAVHAEGRGREEIWNALDARHAYGTSGDRILLWFDLLNGPMEASVPMGSEVTMGETPRFRVRALGAFEQLPGCPDYTKERLSPERLKRLCLNECYHPSDVRKRINRIDVVRIRPQTYEGEPVGPLIEDPWRSFECAGGHDGCTVEFDDPEFVPGQREYVYYVRALQEPSPAVNGDPMRCERDEEGACVRSNPCPASGPDFDPEDECLSMVQERAWSSPIFVLPATGAR